MEPVRHYSHHMERRQMDRFWQSVQMTPTCWEWAGRVDRHGYGAFSSKGKTLIAHRVAYELTLGPIPDGLVLDHLCRNRQCVNPAHLEAVTLRENIVRGMRDRGVQQTHCRSGHPFTAENTYMTKDGRRQCRACRADGMRRARARTP